MIERDDAAQLPGPDLAGAGSARPGALLVVVVAGLARAALDPAARRSPSGCAGRSRAADAHRSLGVGRQPRARGREPAGPPARGRAVGRRAGGAGVGGAARAPTVCAMRSHGSRRWPRGASWRWLPAVSSMRRFASAASPRCFTSAYGALVLAKVGALGVLGGFGWWHRRRTVAAQVTRRARGRAARGARLFLSVAGAELVVMASTVALAVGLSRTPTPAGDAVRPSPLRRCSASRSRQADRRRLAFGWVPDGFALTFLVLAAGALRGGRAGPATARRPVAGGAQRCAGRGTAGVRVGDGRRAGALLARAVQRPHGRAHAAVDGGADRAGARRAGHPRAADPARPARARRAGAAPAAARRAALARAGAVSCIPLVAFALFVGSLYVIYFTAAVPDADEQPPRARRDGVPFPRRGLPVLLGARRHRPGAACGCRRSRASAAVRGDAVPRLLLRRHHGRRHGAGSRLLPALWTGPTPPTCSATSTSAAASAGRSASCQSCSCSVPCSSNGRAPTPARRARFDRAMTTGSTGTTPGVAQLRSTTNCSRPTFPLWPARQPPAPTSARRDRTRHDGEDRLMSSRTRARTPRGNGSPRCEPSRPGLPGAAACCSPGAASASSWCCWSRLSSRRLPASAPAAPAAPARPPPRCRRPRARRSSRR